MRYQNPLRLACWKSRADRRRFRCGMVAVGLVVAAMSIGWPNSRALSAEDDPRPNVILFIGDDIGWNDFGCYGNPAARTPNIDQLAAGGIRFNRAYLTASSCSPSRCSIITGRYPHNNGKAAELHREIAGNLWMFPTLLRSAGYHTALVGKDHMKQSAPPANQAKRLAPFEVVDGGRIPGNSGGHGKWVDFVKNRPRDRPFFFWFASYDAHRAWEADGEWNVDKYGPMHRPEDVVVPPFLVDDAETRFDLASYYNEVTRLDYYIGQVVEELARQDALDNTLILVMADNGRPFPRAKTRLHDSGMKTALVAHWPSFIDSRGAVTQTMLSAIDIAPTILEAAEVDSPDTVQGISFLPVLQKPDLSTRRIAFSEHNWHDYEAHGRSVRKGDLLYIQNNRPYDPWQGPADSVRSPSHTSLKRARDADQLSAAQKDVFLAPRPVAELYNTTEDPFQLNNLAGDDSHAKARQELESLLERWQTETGDTIPQRLSQDQFDRETGEMLYKEREAIFGTTPGDETQAYRINDQGPS